MHSPHGSVNLLRRSTHAWKRLAAQGSFSLNLPAAKDALGIEDAIALLGRIAREADVIGLTATEFAPTNDDEARAGSQVIARLCEAAIDS